MYRCVARVSPSIISQIERAYLADAIGCHDYSLKHIVLARPGSDGTLLNFEYLYSLMHGRKKIEYTV